MSIIEVEDLQLGAFGALAEALGITVDGELNSGWFEAPLGDIDTDKPGLSTVMHDDAQRDSLLSFIDEAMGAPDNETDDGTIWVPVLSESGATVSAVVTPRQGSVLLGFGIEYNRGGSAPTVEVRGSVNVFQFSREGTGSIDTSGTMPDWLILGRQGGTVDLEVTAVLSTDAPAAGATHLGGIGLGVSVPTSSADSLQISLKLDRLQLPGAELPRDFSLDIDSLSELDDDVFEFLLGLIQAQAEALQGSELGSRFAGLAAMFGLRSVANLPDFPVADLIDRGAVALADWINSILADDAALDAWLGQLAIFLDATIDPARNAVTFSIGLVDVAVGLRVDSAAGGGLMLVPWAEASYGVRTGAQVRAAADLLAFNTTTRQVEAFPSVGAHAVFGQEAGLAGPLLVGDPQIGTIRTGISLVNGQPAFALTLYDVVVGGTTHASLDLSSPQAALDAAAGVVDAALINALTDLGRPGELALLLIGLQPPAGITGVGVAELLGNPVAAVRDYWAAVLADSDALGEVIEAAAEMLVGAPSPVAGSGSADDPWRIPLFEDASSPVEATLEVFVDGTELAIDAAIDFGGDAFGIGLDATGGAIPAIEVQVGLARLDFSTGSTRLLSSVDAAAAIRGNGAKLVLPLGEASLQADALGLVLSWSQATGLAAAVSAPGLALDVPGVIDQALELPVPVFTEDGLAFDPAPDWDAVELLVAHAVESSGSSTLTSLMALIGWSGSGPHLDLGGLISDPEAAIRSWLGEMVLDCANIHAVLERVNFLVSGLRHVDYYGAGTAVDPLHLSLGANPRAPGLSIWTDTGCPRPLGKYEMLPGGLSLEVPPEPSQISAALQGASVIDRDIDLLLFGRTSLTTGIEQLADRIVGTDGIVAEPTVLAAGVNRTVLGDWSYRELIAAGITGYLLSDELGIDASALVHIGCEQVWSEAFASDSIDARIGQTPPVIPATGDGEWSVRLPLPIEASADSTVLDPAGAQAERLHQVIGTRSDPVVVIAYGSAGAAAIVAAQTNTSIERVITVGAPWSPVATTGFADGLGADALRLLGHLGTIDTDVPEELIAHEGAQGTRAQFLIDRALATNPANLPSAQGLALRSGLTVDAVFGHLSEDEVLLALGAFVQRAIADRYQDDDLAADQDPTSLHLGVALPVLETALSGVALGAGVTVELVNVDRGPSDDGFDVLYEPALVFDVRFGVEDGWLVGGPGTVASSVEVRWMSTRVVVPLASTAPATCELTLHEASCFGVYHEQWKVARFDSDGTVTSSTASEVHIIVGEVMSRLAALSDDKTTQLVAFLEELGLMRDGGYDPQGLDRLIYDTRAAIDALVSRVETWIEAFRLLFGVAGTGTEIALISDQATVVVDLAVPQVTIAATQDFGPATLAMQLTLDRSGIDGSVVVGTVRPEIGGVQLAATFDSAAASDNSLVLQWQPPGGSLTTVSLLPAVDPGRIAQVLAAMVASAITNVAVAFLRSGVADAPLTVIDEVLESVGLYRGGDDREQAGPTFPVGLFLDPAGWLLHAAPGWTTDPMAEAVATFEALQQLVVPGRAPGAAGWPLADDVSITYRTEAGRLVLGLDVGVTHDFTVASSTNVLAASVGACLSIGLDGSAQPSLSSEVTIDESGLALRIAPSIAVDLVRSAQPPLALYPNGPGLGEVLGAAATSALPPVLNAIAAARNDSSASDLAQDVGQAVFDLGAAMDLREGDNFTEARIGAFAADPAAALAARAGDIATLGLNTLADALDTGTKISARLDGSGRVAIDFGEQAQFTVVVDAGASGPAVELSAEFEIVDVGTFAVDPLRLSLSGASFEARFESSGLEVGAGVELFPIAVARAGIGTALADRVVGIGLCFAEDHDKAVEFRWGLDASEPRVVVVDRSGGGETEDTNTANVAVALSTLGLGLVTQLAADAVGDDFFEVLDGVVFLPGTRSVDPALIDDIDDLVALLNRLGRLALNIADELGPISVGDVVEVGLASDDEGRVGITLDMTGPLELASGETTISLVSDESWIIDPGDGLLTVWIFKETGGSFELEPDFELRGLGLRTAKTSGPLLDLGAASIDAIEFHLYFESKDSDIGLGAQIQLDGLSIAPAGGASQTDGQQNSVANKIMADAADGTTPAARPAFSPSVALQAPPGEDARLTVRAGERPGPWWIVVQRQLGPLYLEQFGFNATESTDGQITGISLLFDAKLDIFGLTAQVDQLGVHWTGGDVFDIDNWRVDLQGLAIAADFSGVAISGGLLKTSLDGDIGYVGMLLGRFGVYGLSLFGGYTDQDGVPSFFVFGAVNGPIGGPPAFFITGLGGGLGINRGLRVPDDVGQMNEYPFIKALDPAASPSDDPLDELRELAEYFPPENGTFWFAAGLSFNSFALVDGVAVASVSFGNGLEINLFGLARMALPRPEAALVSIELGLLARFSTSEGLFLIQAQLTENSWLLYESVRLTGGFAFATWWKGDNRGQFVLSIGGYHPSFKREGYPVVPRVGLEWRVSNDIVVKGGGYFALTSEALMAGVEVLASADFGFLWAEVKFGADGIVYFDPFYFTVTVYAKIKAGAKIKTWFGTIRLSISVGARIMVQGPNFNGRATVEIGPFEATVPFGNTTPVRGKTLIWPDFVEKYLEIASPGIARGLTGITGKGTVPAATGGDASAPSSDGSNDLPYQVFPEFEIMLVSPIPVESLRVTGSSDAVVWEQDLSPSRALGIAPMAVDELDSTLYLHLERYDHGSGRWARLDDDEPGLKQLVDGFEEESETADRATFGTDGFPLGVWGAEGETTPGTGSVPKGDVVIAASRFKLVALANLEAPLIPEIDYRQVRAERDPLPLLASGSTRGSMIDVTGSLAQPATVAEAMLGAQNQLFRESTLRSETGRASFARSRTAPPRFGSLTDGMLRSNPDSVASGHIEMPEPAAPVEPRAPFVSQYLTAGAGIVSRTSGTSVGDATIKRRSAPSVASVNGRLGRQLPIRLVQTAVPAQIENSDGDGLQLMNRGGMPRTDVGTAAVSYRGARVGGSLGTSVVAGLTGGNGPRNPRALDPGARIRPGDVVMLTMPDPELDRGVNRPKITIEGTARVIVLRASGTILCDKIVTNDVVSVGTRARFVIVQADGDVEAATMSVAGNRPSSEAIAVGWHAGARLAAASNKIALGAGCVVTTEDGDLTAGTGWTTGSAFTRRAGATTTTFDRRVQSVAVAVRAAPIERVRQMAVQLTGARRAQHNGRDVAPVVVQAGDQSIMVFDVEPTAASNNAARPVSVRVLAGGDRRLFAVLGSSLTAEGFADVLAERGIAAVASRMRADAGTGCSISWSAPSRRNGSGPRERRGGPESREVGVIDLRDPREIPGGGGSSGVLAGVTQPAGRN